MNEIIMVTGNTGKYKVANDIFSKKGLNLIQENKKSLKLLMII